jgi:hypothetical protein
MAEIDISQVEADTLLHMEKVRVDGRTWDYPQLGGKITIPLTSVDKRENFLLNLHRGRIDLSKGTYQSRARQILILARLDFGGGPHRNPDGQFISSPHLHLYREGYADRWAASLPSEYFDNPEDLWQILLNFMRYCNITEPPLINKGLFL